MITISGGIISKQNGSTITYKLNCERCGNTESSESKVNVSIGVTEVSSMKCSKCGNNQMIKIKHLIEGQNALTRIKINS